MAATIKRKQRWRLERKILEASATGHLRRLLHPLHRFARKKNPKPSKSDGGSSPDAATATADGFCAQSHPSMSGNGASLHRSDSPRRRNPSRDCRGRRRDAKGKVDEDGVEYVLRMIDINCADSEGMTPLHHASRSGSTEMVEFLLRNRADPRARDSEGNTPLHVAAKLGFARVISALREFGGDMEALNGEGASPLSFVLARMEALKKIQEEALNYSKLAEEDHWRSHLAKEVSDGEGEWWGGEWEEVCHEKDVEDWYWEQGLSNRKSRNKLEGGLLRDRDEKRKQAMEERLRKSRETLAREEALDRAWREQVLQKKNCKRYKDYEYAWDRFSQSYNLCLSYGDVPFPVEIGEEGDLARILFYGVPSVQQKILLRKEVLRWHPDKFLLKCGTRLHGPDRERILERVNEIFQALHQLYSSLSSVQS